MWSCSKSALKFGDATAASMANRSCFTAGAEESCPGQKLSRPTVSKKTIDPLAGLLESIQSLGLSSVTLSEVHYAVKELFPKGWSALPESELIRSVFIHLKRHDSPDKVAR